MAVVKGPLFSLDASGSVAGAITFSKWKGRAYVRQRVIPSNPKSGAQTGRRAMLKFLSQAWADIADVDQATWQTLADQLVASRFNAYVGENLKTWHNFLSPTQATPPAKLGGASDNVLTAAVKVENRWKLSFAGTALGDAWGIVIFGSLSHTFTPTVGKVILVEPDTTIAAHDVYWTPPDEALWYFNSMAFSDDGVMAAAGGEEPPAP